MNIVIQGLEKRMNIDDKFNVIAKVLSEYFDDSQLRRVMAHWEKNYSQEPAFVLQRFVKEVCISDALVVKRADILRDIVAGLNHLASEHLQSKHQQNLTEKEQCFYDMLRDLQAQTPLDEKEDVAQSFLLAVGHMDFDNDALFAQWFEAKSGLMPTLPNELLPELVGSYYRSLCDWLGPTEADELLAGAIARRKAAGQARAVAALL